MKPKLGDGASDKVGWSSWGKGDELCFVWVTLKTIAVEPCCDVLETGPD